MIIGLTGRIAAGKGVVADFFKEKGFEYLSLSREVREEATKRGILHERKNLQDLGNSMREVEGSGVLAKRIKEKMSENKNYIIDGIRNAGEIQELRNSFKNNFYLISVDGNLDFRWKHLQSRGKESDPKSFEEFIKADNRDFEENLENGQQVKKCMMLADYSVLNNSTIENLREKLKDICRKIEKC